MAEEQSGVKERRLDVGTLQLHPGPVQCHADSVARVWTSAHLRPYAISAEGQRAVQPVAS
jgi:hypothetical protein